MAITGAIDIVADGAKAYCIRNGHPMMSAITGTGCQLSALTAAFLTANPGQPLELRLPPSAPWALRDWHCAGTRCKGAMYTTYV